MSQLKDDLSTFTKLQDGNLIYGSSQNVGGILHDAQARHKEGLHGTGEMKHAARIPFVVIEKYCNDRNITFNEFMGNKDHIKSVVNDPSLKAFRIWPGAV